MRGARSTGALSEGMARNSRESLLRSLRLARDELTKDSPRRTYFELRYRDEVEIEVDSQLGENPVVKREQSPKEVEQREMTFKAGQDASQAKET